ncbi:hypothetical protein DPX16_7529 [Anabarilius grahami]|uniref:Uncharacterized protein n=1 Tax=Anabarilius grahami TaxID=495550 RepID=A0A3N0YTE3_ANAGA|nr:hypothetical protein DPX16_7529 [Anabarilius grahami]
MPSKRKKNKRRMRRVQAQRRALEEQYASSGKGTTGVCAVSAPVPARVAKLTKTSECPVSVPIPLAVVAPVDVPAEDPLAVVAPVDVPAEDPLAVVAPVDVPAEDPLVVVAPVDIPAEDSLVEPVVLEVPVTDAVKDEVVKAAEDLGQSLVEPPAEEPAVIEEDESVTVPLSETSQVLGLDIHTLRVVRGRASEKGTYSCIGFEALGSPLTCWMSLWKRRAPVGVAVTGVIDIVEEELKFAITSVDEPVSIPAESETHVLAQPVETVDTEHVVEAELPAEDPVVEVPVPEETVTTAETVAAVETVTETVVTEVKPVADAAVEVDGHVVGVVGEPAIEGEAITVETEPVEVNRVAEVTEVPDTIHLHGTLQWTLCMSVFACTTGDVVLSVLCTCLDNWA